MKKRRTKLRKFLLRTLLFLLLLTGLSAVLLRSRTVQTLLAQKTAQWLSKQIGAKVKIRAFEFDFFRNIHLEGVFIADQKGDTMIAFDALDVQYKSLDRTLRRIDFYEAEFNRANVHIGFHKGSRRQNIQFLVDYINGPKRPKGTPKKIWTLHFDDARLKNTRYVQFDEAKMVTQPGILDEYNLQFNKINGHLQNLFIIDDSFHFQLKNLSTTERSGLQIKKMQANCNIHYYGMDLTDLQLNTNCSELSGELHFKYPGYNNLDEFISNTQWDGTLKKSKICLADLSVFDASFQQHPESLDVRNLKITGTYDHLRLGNADIRMGQDTRVKGTFYMEGLPRWRTTYCEFDVPELRTTAADLNRLLRGVELPALLNDAGLMVAKGKFTGQFVDFNWNGLVTSNFGDLQTDIVLNFKPGLKNAEISGKLFSTGFDLGIINENLGRSGFDLELNGTGLDPSTFKMELNTNLPEFFIRGRHFADAEIHGELTAKNFNGLAIFKDPRLNSRFEGIIDFSGAIPVFDFTAETRGIDLYELNLDTVHTLVWGDYEVNATGLDPDEISGSAVLRNIAIHRNGKVYQFSREKISKSNLGKQTRIELTGDFATGLVDGRLSLKNIQALAVNSFAGIFPDRIRTMDYNGRDSFRYSLRIPETALICSLVDPALSTGVLDINGNFNRNLGTAIFNLKPLDLKYGELTFVSLDANSKLHPDTGLSFRISAAAMDNGTRRQFLNMNLQGKAFDGCADYNLNLTDRTGLYKIDLLARSEVFRDSITLFPSTSHVYLGNETWTISESSQLTILNNGRIICRELYLDGDAHFVEARGVISDREYDTLNVDFGNFSFDNLRPFLPQSNLDSFGGRMNGNIHISALTGSARFTGEISGRNLKYFGQDFGDADLTILDRHSTGRVSVDCGFVRGLLKGVNVKGSVGYDGGPPDKQLALRIEIPGQTSVLAAQPFLKDILTFRSGFLEGEFFIRGSTDAPKLEGTCMVSETKITVDYLNTNYILNGRIDANQKGFFTPKPFIIRDDPGLGTAQARMSITHNNFDNFKMDLRMDSVRNLKVLNTTQKNNDLYFGNAWADGDCRIFGSFDRINMDIHLKNKKNSKINLLYSDVEQNEIMGFVKFVKTGAPPSKRKKPENSVINRIDIALDVNTDLDAEFIIDKQLGDIIKGRGNGSLRMVYDETETFFLYGNYVVDEGEYAFSLPGINVITRKIDLTKGGTIRWLGDPFDADVNISGKFIKKISPSALMAATSSTTTQKSYAPITIESSLYMRGKLFSPDISFDIQAPELESSGGGTLNDVYRVIQRIRADKDETMRQAVALLLFGNFIPPSFSQLSSANSVISGSGVAGNSLSVIATGVVNDIFTRLGIPTRIQVNIDDVKNSTGNTATKVFINSEWFLTERIRLDVNYDPTVAMLVSNVALPLNFNLEYMTRNENWRIKAFSRSNNLLLQTNGSNITQGVSGNTIGAGLVYRKEFDTFRFRKKNLPDSVNTQRPLMQDSLPPL